MESFLDIPLPLWYPEDGKQTCHKRPPPQKIFPGKGKAGFPYGGEEVPPLKNRLEELRKARNISQEELAAALEVSRQTIGSLERGRYNPSILLAFKIARYFGLTIEDIFIYEEDAT